MSKLLAALSSILYVALHVVHYTDDAGKRRVAKPGDAFYPPESEVAFLNRAGAVRKATEAEIALYEKQNGGKAKAAGSRSKKGSGAEGGGGESGDASGGDGSNESLV